MPRHHLGWIPPDLHKLLFNRSRLRLRIICTATLLIVVLSLTSISFILSQPPIEYVAVQQMGIDTPNPPPVIPPPVLARPGPEVGAPVTELLGTLVYHPFVHPSPPGYLVNQIVRPIKAHRGVSDECLDRWVSTGQWDDPCGEGMVQDAIVDLVYVWVNGSCVSLFFVPDLYLTQPKFTNFPGTHSTSKHARSCWLPRITQQRKLDFGSTTSCVIHYAPRASQPRAGHTPVGMSSPRTCPIPTRTILITDGA
jgi:hypothetical protein